VCVCVHNDLVKKISFSWCCIFMVFEMFMPNKFSCWRCVFLSCVSIILMWMYSEQFLKCLTKREHISAYWVKGMIFLVLSMACEISGVHSSFVEDSRWLECDALLKAHQYIVTSQKAWKPWVSISSSFQWMPSIAGANRHYSWSYSYSYNIVLTS
jgi:hypothetical protein